MIQLHLIVQATSRHRCRTRSSHECCKEGAVAAVVGSVGSRTEKITRGCRWPYAGVNSPDNFHSWAYNHVTTDSYTAYKTHGRKEQREGEGIEEKEGRGGEGKVRNTDRLTVFLQHSPVIDPQIRSHQGWELSSNCHPLYLTGVYKMAQLGIAKHTFLPTTDGAFSKTGTSRLRNKPQMFQSCDHSVAFSDYHGTHLENSMEF